MLRQAIAALSLCFILASTAGCGGGYGADVIVYGGTPGGITAAIAAAREGASVILLEPTRHIGGMSTNGLNRDESEHMARDETFGGLANRFFADAAKRSGQNPGRKHKVWHSHVAERVFLEMLGDAGVTVRTGQVLDGVSMDGTTLRGVFMDSDLYIRGEVFIDATYEGDLLAQAGVSHATGREASSKYGESLAGVRYIDEAVVVAPRDANGQLLFGVMPGPTPTPGSASPHPTPYNVRLNITADPNNRVPIDKPPRYDPRQYELLAKCIEAGIFSSVGQIIGRYGMPGGKLELNNRQQAVVSLSMPGEQTPWTTANHYERETIHRAYRDYTHGMLWFLMTDPRVPQAMRNDIARFGLCADEWTDNGHWPWQLYVREARRMLGAYVMTESDITTELAKEDAIHLGSHFIDSHHTARYATSDGKGFINEGRIWQRGEIYQLPYRAITPLAEECDNLLVPVCVSSSHVAFCSIRVEASWMMIGEAAGIAAAMAIDRDLPVQSIGVPQLQQRLRELAIPIDLPKAN